MRRVHWSITTSAQCVRSTADSQGNTSRLLVDGNAEGQDDLLSDPGTTPGRIPLFHIDDCGNDFLRGSLWTGLCRHCGRKEPPIFPLCQRGVGVPPLRIDDRVILNEDDCRFLRVARSERKGLIED
jgi:hypothetical protein